jgi:hypothetical protein
MLRCLAMTSALFLALPAAVAFGPAKTARDEPSQMRAKVLFFVATDCLYSDRYFPEMLRLQEEFAARGVSFRWVYPNRYEHLSTVEAHQRQFDALPASISLDADGALTRQAGVHITPEAAVLVRGKDGAWITAYHGRIDDRYVRIGLERPQAEHHDLEIAIQALLEGKPAPPAKGSAVGCSIMSSAAETLR